MSRASTGPTKTSPITTASWCCRRGFGARALALLRTWAFCAAVYFAIVIGASLFWPRTELRLGQPRCFDDWCIAVEKASRQEAQGGVSYRVTLRLSSTALRVTQRENNVVVYLGDQRGRRYDPAPDLSAVAMNVQLAPQETVLTTRSFRVPADARELGLVIDHEGGFPIGWFIVGYETWFHKPAIVRLPVS